jgi:hypothetical protein
MSIILSLSHANGSLWAAGPEGLYTSTGGDLQAVIQPEANLYCCCAIHDRVLVGGLPHGVAFKHNGTDTWQAGWTDAVDAPVVTLAADPQVEHTGVLLAGTDGGGILRTINRGSHWYSRNYGLRSFNVLALAWAPPAPATAWPRWQMAFAATEEGVYHSPNGGRGWKRSECPEHVYQTLAVDQGYHTTGVVLVGTEGDGLLRSNDGGLSFAPVPGTPSQINALAALAGGWLLSDAERLWHSHDGLTWTPIGDTPALVLLATDHQVWAGSEHGLTPVAIGAPA